MESPRRPLLVDLIDEGAGQVNAGQVDARRDDQSHWQDLRQEYGLDLEPAPPGASAPEEVEAPAGVERTAGGLPIFQSYLNTMRRKPDES